MKKIVLSITLLFFVISGYSQLIKPVKIDSLVRVSLPGVHQEKDTLGQQVYSGYGMYGYMTVIRTASDKNNTPLKREKDLNKVLKDCVKSIQAQSAGSVALNVRDTIVGALKAKAFTLKSEDGSGNIQLTNFTIIYTQEVTYTFEYVYPEMRKDLVKDEYTAFISSIRLSPGLQRNDQYLSDAKGMSSAAKIETFGGAGLVIIVAVVLIARRKRKLAIS